MNLAEQLRKTASIHNSAAITGQYEKIIRDCKQRANNGHFDHTYYGEILPGVKEKLKIDGLTLSNQRQTGMNEIGYDITW